jgi:signal transduction histidine kinase/ActR/RegA family two-component response regulator
MAPSLDHILRTFVHEWLVAVIVFDHERRVVYSNPSARRLFGVDFDRLTPEERAIHATLRDRAGRLVAAEVSPSAHALRGTTVYGGDYQLVRADGTTTRVIIDACPIRGPEGDVVAAACVIAERQEDRRVPEYRLFQGIANWLETTERGRAPRETLAILAETGRALAASLDSESTLDALVRGLVPRLADVCAIRVIDEDGRVRRLHGASSSPELAQRVAALETYYQQRIEPDTYEAKGLGAVLRTGQPLLLPRVTDAYLRSVAHDAEHLAGLRELGAGSLMHVPILVRGRPRGAITFVRTAWRAPYETRDLALAEELCDRAAVAIENARLFRDSERQRREAELLTDVARVLVETMDAHVVAQCIADGVKILLDDTAWAAVYSFQSTSEDARVVAESTQAGVAFPWTRVLPPGAGMVGLATARRQTVVADDVLQHPDVTYPPEARAQIESTAYRSVMAIPLIAHDRVLGALAVGARIGRRFEPQEIALLSVFASQAAVSFHNARLFEESERARADAEAANRSKDDFLAVLSHELRTPLTAILGWVRMLDRGNLPPARTAEAVSAVDRNARLQARLINDMLDVSRIVTGKLDVERTLVHLGAVVHDAIEAARQDGHARELLAEPTIDAAATVVVGDRVRLQQVVSNLIANAVQYTPRGGRIEVTLRSIRETVELSVADTGDGIAPEDLPRIFERFHQVDASRTRRHGGLGLGLAIARHLVELHGGSVQAASAGRGRGSTFTVQLPRAPALPALVTEVRRSPTDIEANATLLPGVRVLFVDDNEDARRLVRTALQAAGAHVQTAASARDALELFDTAPFDVVVSDIGMPDVDGYDFVRELRGRQRAAGVPAIALTAYAGIDDARRAVAAGFQRHLAKPIDPADLVAIVRSVIAPHAA